MTEAESFAGMMHRAADLQRRIATELAAPVIAAVSTCETSLRNGGKLLFCHIPFSLQWLTPHW